MAKHHVFEVRFPSPASPDLMHKALNFIEDVYREVEALGVGEVSDIDHYGNGVFTITLTRNRQAGTIRKLLIKSLSHHMLTHDAIVKETV